MASTVDSVAYQRGYGGYTLPTNLLNQLTNDRDAALATYGTNPAQMGLGTQIYQDLYGWLTAAQSAGTAVDIGVVAWLKAAININGDNGSFDANLIRDYTSDIFAIREGQPLSLPRLQVASNNIALSLADDIIDNNGSYPSIEGLGADDAGSIAQGVFSDAAYPQGVFSPWAGTILFPFLGEGKFYTDWILNPDTVQGPITNPQTGQPQTATFKSVDGTYDLISTIEAFGQTAHALVFSNFFGSIYRGAINSQAPFPDQSTLVTATSQFFDQYYGFQSDQAPEVGLDTALDGSFPGNINYVAGTLMPDTIAAPSGTNIIVAGPNDDTVTVPYGGEGNIIDGGDGSNTIDYSSSDPLLFTLQAVSGSPSLTYRVEVDPQFPSETSDPDFVFNFQNIIGSSKGAILRVPVLSSGFWGTLPQTLSINLGTATEADSSNGLDLDGGDVSDRAYFAISGDSAAPESLLVSAADAQLSGSEGISVSNPGNVLVSAPVSGGTLTISGDLSGSLQPSETIKFVGSSGNSFVDASGMTSTQVVEVVPGSGSIDASMGKSETLRLDNVSSFQGVVSGFATGNVIDLTSIGLASSATISADNVLSVTDGNGTTVALQLDPNEDYESSAAVVSSDGNGGTNVTLGGKEDLAFVIDTTGSMEPYIDAVKADATSLINAAFNNNTTKTQIGVVSFKDPQAGYPDAVVLPFTTETNFADRQSAAINAIDSLGADGGGDIPEGDNSGLLLALDGSMGAWRQNAAIHRIILFTDAPVKDTYLAAMVNEYADNIGINPSALTGDPPGDPPVVIQVETIQVGSDSSATASIQQVALTNNGMYFDAPTPTDLTAALLNVIKAPAPTSYSIAATNADKAEGNSGTTPFTFTVTRSGDASTAATLTYTVTGTGAQPVTADDFADGIFPSGQVSFAAGDVAQVVTIGVNGDTTVEPDESFAVTLTGSAGTVITKASAIGTIVNDDTGASSPSPATYSIAATDADKAEGNSGTTPFTFTVSRAGDASGATTLTYTVAGTGTQPATADDFAGNVFPSGQVSFAAGDTSEIITVGVNGDTTIEPDENFAVTLSGPAGTTITTASATGTIVNDDGSDSGTRSGMSGNSTTGSGGGGTVVDNNGQVISPPTVPVFSTPDEITNTPTTTVSGVATPGGTVTLMVGNSTVATVQADAATGAFSASVSLVLGANAFTSTVTTSVGTSTTSAPLAIFDVPAPVSGVSSANVSSADLGQALSQGATLRFVAGTESIALTDGVLSVGQDTNEAATDRLFIGLLGRPDNNPVSQGFIDQALATGTTPSGVAAAVLSSAEYAAHFGSLTDSQYVQLLYQHALGRSADPSPWTSLLASGVSRADVAVAITSSPEAKAHLATATADVFARDANGTLINELFVTGLGQEVGSAGLAGLKAALIGIPASTFAQELTTTPAFVALHGSQSNADYVASLYQVGLGRTPDAGSLSTMTQLLASGAVSRADVLLGIATSPEATARLTATV